MARAGAGAGGALDPLSLLAAATEAPDRPALIAPGSSCSYRELASVVLAAAARLPAPGTAPEDGLVHAPGLLALRGTLRLETVIALLAAFERGLPVLPLHPRFTRSELDAVLAAVPGVTFLDAAAVDALVATAPVPGEARARAAPSPARSAASPPAWSAEPGSRAVPWPAPSPASALAVLPTSGTTGAPRLAVLSRAAFAASAAASATRLPLEQDARWLLCLPLAHVGGLSILTRCVSARATLVLLPRFEPAEVLAAIESFAVTHLSVVPTMLRRLLAADTRGALRRLRAAIVGGAGCAPALLDACAAARVPARTTYGLTEACSQVTLSEPGGPGTGLPLPGVELRLAGNTGVIEVRGPTLFTGWLGAPPHTGWLTTGDLGRLDAAGQLHVQGRVSELIITGGENVSPAEVEHALEACPGVAGAAVFGLPDEEWGQLVCAAVVPEDGSELRLEQVALAASRTLAGFKLPKRWCRAEALPLGPTGKLDRRAAVSAFASRARPLLLR